MQRKAGPDRPWTSTASVDQALAAAAEALVASEALVPAEVEALPARLEEAAPLAGLDAGAAFARALVLGSAPGEAAAQAAANTLAGVRPEARSACADGLALAPSPAVGEAVLRLLDHASPGVCADALGVLRFRKQAAYGAVVLLVAHPDHAVAASAARCLGTVHERAAAARVLRHVLSRGLADDVALPIAEVLLSLGDRAGLAFVRDRLEADSVEPSLSDDARVAYLRLLGFGGDAADRELFFRSLEPGPRDAAAVGWFGHPDLVDWLLGSLEAANETRRARAPGGGPSLFETAAARALHRILGSPSVPGDAARSDGLVVDAGAWRSYWQMARGHLGARQKLRFGAPYTPAATIAELEAETLPAIRAEAALELAIVSRGKALLETDDWAGRQRAVLASARAALAGDGYAPGDFAGAHLTG